MIKISYFDNIIIYKLRLQVKFEYCIVLRQVLSLPIFLKHATPMDKRERDITGNSILAVEIDLKNIENH